MACTFVDSSAIVKLLAREPESAALRSYLRRRRPLVASALARVEVPRALARAGIRNAPDPARILGRLDLVRVSDRVLDGAARIEPAEVRSLDAIHLATAQLLGRDLGPFVTYDERMARSAVALGLRVVAPR